MAKNNSLVYRIENEHGEGPYRTRKGTLLCYIPQSEAPRSDYDSDDKHPAPADDTKLIESLPDDVREETKKADFGSRIYGWFSNYRCGFSSIKQLRAWFYNDKILKWMDKNNYRIVVYKGESYHGNSQALIHKGAKKVKEISLLSLTEPTK